MIIWLASYPRSGNTFFRVLMNSVFNIKTYSIYDDRFDIGADKKLSDVVGHEFLPEGFSICSARRSSEVFVLKTHDYPSEVCESDKVIYLIRDGRESTLSFFRFHKDFMGVSKCLLDVIGGDTQYGGWGEHVQAWSPAERPNTLLIKFEELVSNPTGYIEKISEFTGFRAVSGNLPTFDELHATSPRFFRSGKKDSWKNVFSEFEQHVFWMRNYSQMTAYGYDEDVPELFSVNASEALYWSERCLEKPLTACIQNVTEPETETVPASELREERLCILGEKLFQDGDIDGAESKFLEAIQHAPGFADGYNNLGVLYWQKGETELALEYFTTGLRLVPDHPELVINSVEVMIALDCAQDARELCEAYLSTHPDDASIAGLMRRLDGVSPPGQSPNYAELNADGESLFQAGDIEGALGKFIHALSVDEDSALAYNNLAALYWNQGETEKAVAALANGLEKQPYDHDLILTGGNILAAMDLRGDALALVEGYLVNFPEDKEVETLREQLCCQPDHVSSDAVVIDSAVQDHCRLINNNDPNSCAEETIAVITSIAPSRIEVQQRAIQSWLDLGLEVMSLNVQEEIDCLKVHFTGVTFIPAPRNGRKRLGKPYVYVNDMFAALRETGRETVGIINSDIILRSGRDLLALIRRESKRCLLYGSRIDIDNPEDGDGCYYRRGFDLFFMGRDVTKAIPENNFMLGMPWWDYWLPCLMLSKGIEIKRIENPRAFHLTHEANYNAGHMQDFSKEFTRFFPSEPFLDYYRQSRKSAFSEYGVFVLSDCVLDHVGRNSHRIDIAGEGVASNRSGQAGQPKVTALVSTYASEAFIGECLSDLVSQTIADQIEVIVIDAASPQDERSVVEQFQAKYPNIRYRRMPERIGIYEAWNIAARMATGEYLISCSTNDRLRHDACEILARTLDDQPEVALAYGYTYLTRTPHQPFDRATLFSLYVWTDYDYEDLLERCMVGPHPMWRRSLHDTVGYFDESLMALGDQDFWLRVGREHTMKVIPYFTGLYLVSSDSLTGNSERNRIEEDRIRAKWGLRYRYGKWFNKRLAEPETVRCTDGPTVKVVVQAAGADLSTVADTLDTLSGQAYPNWTLAVLSDTPCPDPLFREHPQLAWIEKSSGAVPGVVDGETGYLVFMKAGERLDPLFLSDACAAFEQHPEWQVLYFDDDGVAQDGELQDPRFKPDFNLDLLRSTDYIGNACLFRAAAVRAVAEGDLADGSTFDLILRIHYRYGRQAVGHLAEPRFHRVLAGDDDVSDLSQRRQALQAQLARCEEQAVIEAGAVPGSFMLSYASREHPKVSILLVARERTGTVVDVVRGILEKTDYPNYEILILVDPAVPTSVIPALEALSVPNVILRLECNTRPVSAVDLGRLAREAEGEFLLWLNDNTHVLQDVWLSRLVANGLRKGVGATAPRLVNKDKILLGAGVMPGVGKRGAGARMHSGLHMMSDGYMGRAQLAQEVGAVQALCLLVKKSLFEQAGGFDQTLAIDLYRDIDLCERIRATGRQIVWTPLVTLMHMGPVSAIDGVPASETQARREVEVLQERWLGQFAREASYNRNLSLLRSDYTIETNIAPVWNHEPGETPRILSFGVGSYGSWQYRVRQPLDVMRGSGLVQCAHTELAGKKSIPLPTVVELERLQPVSLLMHNTSHDDYIEAMEQYKRVNNTFIVFGQDDLITALPSKNPFSKTVYRDMKQRIRKCLSIADRLVVTTEPLADALRGMADDVWIVPNYLDAAVWNVSPSLRRSSDRPRVGWAGAQQHQGDLELLEAVVHETADEVDWVFFGMCPQVLRPYVREIHNAVSFEDYPHKLASLNLDLAVAPLEHNRFNECKSNLRILEYGMLGWPVIATDIAPYQDAPVCRVINKPDAWIKAIREHIGDLDETRREGDVLRNWVKSNWLLEHHLSEWMAVLDPDANVAEPLKFDAV